MRTPLPDPTHAPLDVVVVGAGPTGLMLARELRLAGVTPLVLERDVVRSDRSKALGLGGRSLDILERRGLLARFEAAAAEWPAFAPELGGVARLLHFGGVSLELERLIGPPPRFLNLFQSGTERCLEACALEAGVTLTRGHEVIALEQDTDSVVLTTRSAGETQTIRARFVVGCDGAHSAVRKLAGIGFPGAAATQVLRLADLELPAALRAPARWGSGRPPLVPLANGLVRIVTKEPLPPDLDRSAPMTFEEFQASVRRVHGFELPELEPRWMSRFTDTSRLAERYRLGRVLVAGDAAHVHLPAGGPGINAGLNDAINLGWKLAATIRGTAPAGLLDSYHDERHPIGERLLMQTRAQSAMLHGTPEADALRALIRRLLRGEQALRDVVDMLQGNDVRYDVGAGDHPLAGAWAPNLPLTLADGRASDVSTLMQRGRALFLALGRRPDLTARVAAAARDLDVVVAAVDGEASADALLIRPDGHVAFVCAADEPAAPGLERALSRWCSPSPRGRPGIGSTATAGTWQD